MVLVPPYSRGRCNSQCPTLSPNSISTGTSEGEHLHLLEGNYISEIYVCSVFIKGHLFRLKSEMFQALSFPHLQPLTLLLPSSPSSGLTHSLLILPLGERTTHPGMAPGRLVVQHALGHTQAAAKC